MLPYSDSRVTKFVLAVFFLIILGYAYFEARGILFGPSIDVTSNVEQVSDPYIEIKGSTAHIAQLSMDGASVPVTESGAFDVPYVLAPGYNRIVLDAKDKYGKSTERVIEIVYTPSAAPSPDTSATSSTITATSTLQIASSTAPMAQ
jgi:hypothetical protein